MNNLCNREFDLQKMQPMMNEDGDIVDSYLPRKCFATSRIIGSKEHSSIQLRVPKLDENGQVVPEEAGFNFAICGFIRSKGRSDGEIYKLLKDQQIYPLPEVDYGVLEQEQEQVSNQEQSTSNED